MRRNALIAAVIVIGAAVTLALVPVPATACTNPTSLTVTKTAETQWEQEYEWTIDKSVTPATWDMFTGDTGTSKYTITVTKSGPINTYYVTGEICAQNTGEHPTEGLSIKDVVQYRVGSGDWTNILPVTTVPLGSKTSIPVGQTYCYDYKVSFTPVTGATAYRNEARVTITNHPDGTHTFYYRQSFSLPGTPTTLINNTINVTDTNTGVGPWSFSASGSQTYNKTFACDTDEGTKNNTATITETGQSDGASVVVTCYALDVTKTANTEFTRTYHWTIDKSADYGDGDPAGNNVGPLVLGPNQTDPPVTYTVTVDLDDDPPYTNSGWKIFGDIDVSNPAPFAAEINGVSDAVAGIGDATVDCGVTFPYTLAAGGTLNCTYSLDVADATGGINTATTELQNYDYDYLGAGTADGTTDFAGTATATFSTTPTTLVDECVVVSDDNPLNALQDPVLSNPNVLASQLCWDDTLPAVFTYALYHPPHTDTECLDHVIINTASFETFDDDNDTTASGSAEWTVAVIETGCELTTGCTLTPGYWKTHSYHGPAAHEHWSLLDPPQNPDAPFFDSGQTYYEVLWTSPKGGNAYYILAHAYIAAYLNTVNGASMPEAVKDAFDGATALFNLYSVADFAQLKGKTATSVRAEFLGYATILDQYNNGLAEGGPPHCSEIPVTP